jgi:hypothetical protein
LFDFGSKKSRSVFSARSVEKRLDSRPQIRYNHIILEAPFIAVNGFRPETGKKVGRCRLQEPEIQEWRNHAGLRALPFRNRPTF